jgi:hypothetical protein
MRCIIDSVPPSAAPLKQASGKLCVDLSLRFLSTMLPTQASKYASPMQEKFSSCSACLPFTCQPRLSCYTPNFTFPCHDVVYEDLEPPSFFSALNFFDRSPSPFC